jgi:hypothetical protein
MGSALRQSGHAQKYARYIAHLIETEAKGNDINGVDAQWRRHQVH